MGGKLRCKDNITIDSLIQDLNKHFNNEKSLEKKIKAAEIIISLLPNSDASDLYKKQLGLFDIWTFFNSFQKDSTSNNFTQKEKDLQQNSTINKESIQYSDERFWNISNQLIYQEIIKIVNSFKSFSKIECKKDELILKLNLCYSLITSKDIRVPDRNGVFHEMNQIQSCQNIDPRLLELYKMATDNDLSPKLLHLDIVNNNVKQYDTKEFISFIAKSLNKADDSKVEALQKEIFGDINNLKFDHFDNSSLFGELSESIIYEMYAKQIQNTFHNPFPPRTCRRWTWELMQNASDSIAGDQTKQSVSIWYKFYNDRVEFIHNGSPFTNEQLWSLVCMYSKKESKETVGKFGTGFTSTHILSRIVEIETNIKDKEQITRKKIILYRDGKDKEDYIEGIKKTMNEITILTEKSDETKFIYILKDKNSQNAAKEGIQELILNLPRVFVFNQKLENVTINIDKNCSYYNEINDKQNIKFEFKRGDIHEIISNEELKKVSIFENNNKHTFIISSKNIQHPQNQKLILIEGAIEIDENDDTNKTIIQRGKNNFFNDVFLPFPLIGFEKFNFPFSIQCNHFLSLVEREALDLNNLYEPGDINGTILASSIEIFNRLIQYFSENEYSNLFIILKKLKQNSFIKLIDAYPNKKKIIDYYQENILYPMRKYFFSLPVILTSKNKFTRIYQPKFNNQKQKYYFDLGTNDAIIWDNKEENFFDLISLFANTYPEPESNDKWVSSLKQIASHSVFQFQNLIDAIETFSKLEDVTIFSNDISKIKAIDELISFAQNKPNFNSFKIIPAQDETFHSPKEIKLCKIDQELLEILEDHFHISYKSQIIHSEIHNYKPEYILSYQHIEKNIINCFNNPNISKEQKIRVSIQILTIFNLNKQNIDFHKIMVKIYCTFYPEYKELFSMEKNGDFNNYLTYDNAYKCLILDMNEKLKQYSNLGNLIEEYNISEEKLCQLLNDYYDACFNYFSNKSESLEQMNFLIPNSKGDFIQYIETIGFMDNGYEPFQVEAKLSQLVTLLGMDKEWSDERIIHKDISAKYAFKKISFKVMTDEMDKKIYEMFNKNQVSTNIRIFKFILSEILGDKEYKDKFPKIFKKLPQIFQKVNKKSKLSFYESDQQSPQYQQLLKEKEALLQENQLLKEKNNKLMEKNQSFEEKNNKLMEENKKQKEKIDKLIEEIERLQQENNGLKEENERLQQENNRLKEENERLQQENNRLKEENKRLRQENSRLKKEIQDLRDILSLSSDDQSYSSCQYYYYYYYCPWYSYHPDRNIAYAQFRNCPESHLISVLYYLTSFIKRQISISPIQSVKINKKYLYSNYLKENMQESDFSDECDDFDLCVQYINGFKTLIKVVATTVSKKNSEIPIDYQMVKELISEIITSHNNKDISLLFNQPIVSETVLIAFWGKSPDIKHSLEFSISKFKSIVYS